MKRAPKGIREDLPDGRRLYHYPGLGWKGGVKTITHYPPKLQREMAARGEWPLPRKTKPPLKTPLLNDEDRVMPPTRENNRQAAGARRRGRSA